MSLPLFETPSGELPVRIDGERVVYACPHCDGEMSQDVAEESLDELRADPACCFCRAAYAGMPFAEWRKLPMAVRRTHVPPAGWRRP